MKTLTSLVLLTVLTLSATANAQLANNAADKRAALQMGLYPPDIIMRHQQRLGITDAQRSEMAGAVKTFQTDVAELQWQLQSEQQTLRQMLATTDIDSGAALAQVNSVLELENAFKRAHFKLLIAIKNALTEDQVAIIKKELRKRRAGANEQ